MSRSSPRNEESEVIRSPRSTRKQKADFSGLDIGSDGDDGEYSEPDRSKDNIEDDGEFEDEGLERAGRSGSSRGSKRKLEDDEDDGDSLRPEDELEEDEEEEDAEPDAEADEPSKGTNVSQKKVIKKVPKKRGRKKLEVVYLEDGVFDAEGNPINVANDEVVMENEDPKGQAKVDTDGYLLGGREYRNKTFTVLGSGRRLYMVSTDPARLVGFRDSYLLFKTHRSLFKKICSEEEKTDLIERGLIPNSYKGRSVNLVCARSIFREFGAKVLRGGKKVIDDFWEDRAVANGDIPGAYADPLEFIKFPNRPAVAGDTGSNGGSTPVSSAPLIGYQTDPTWLYKVALQTKDYNKNLLENRLQLNARGSKDVYTNSTFYPVSTQPTKAKRRVLSTKGTALTYDTIFYQPDLRKKATGLKDVSKEVFADLDEDIVKAILEQQAFERSL